MGMDLLAQMATFVSVVDGKSLSAAARAQRLSLPAVSRQLRALEEDLGASLIVRSTRRLHITDAGLQWYEHCRRVLHDIDQAREAVRGTKGVHGTLVISASLTFGTVVIVPRLARLSEKHPRLVVDLRLEDQLVDLVGEGVDVAVRAGSPPPDSTAYVAHPIFAMERILVAAPRWLRKHGMPREPSHLARHECLIQVTPAGTVVRWSLRRGGADTRTIDVQGRLRTNAPSALRDLAVDGGGIAYLPAWLVTSELERGVLRRVLPEWSSVPITAWAVHRSELRGTPRLRAFLDAMPRTAAEIRP
ncbi:MAG: Transcriptional regulator, LysR family [Myxococcaceae bacterium]|nr:Transcriptional regulator, LysR family [Myxococcaceae bacterium]